MTTLYVLREDKKKNREKQVFLWESLHLLKIIDFLLPNLKDAWNSEGGIGIGCQALLPWQQRKQIFEQAAAVVL